MEPLKTTFTPGGAYTMTSKNLRLASEAISISVDGQAADLRFSPPVHVPFTLGPRSGSIQRSRAAWKNLTIHRELFCSDDQKSAALRITLRNDGSTPVRMESVRLMRMDRQEEFLVGGGGIAQWKVLRYPFHKSDIPSCYSPTVADKDFTDAVFSCTKAVPGKGVLYNLVNAESRTVSSGPVMIVRNTERPDAPLLMMAITDIRNHYIQQSLTTSEDRSAFAEFSIDCDFLDTRVDPGEETGTHWLLVMTGAHESDLLDQYVETVAEIHLVPVPPSPSPTIYCTWYFYTFLISERYVLEELDAIRSRRVPLDVFQIDDGWMDTYGTYAPHPEKFPRGMAVLADRIREDGMTPGIWVAPFVIDAASPTVQRYPDMFQKDIDGQRIVYATDRDCYVLDATAPGAEDYLREVLLRLKSWGFRYFKLDWLRAIYEFPNVVLHDPKVNRLEGYHRAMQMVRKALGRDVFILACGGLSDPGALGLVNGTRTSKDVRGIWNGPEGVPKSGAVIQLKQNLLRSYSNRFYHTDPDATQIRIRKERFSELETRCVGVYQSEGHYTDEEARTICTHQFLCGGMITISERFPELQPERLALLRHISPAITPPARILDYAAPVCPTLFLSEIRPDCRALGDYRLLTVGNWEDQAVTRRLVPDALPRSIHWAPRLAVFEFHTQRFLGVFRPQDVIEVELPPHAVRVLRILPWDGENPVLLGTDLHLTGGAVEIRELAIEKDVLRGRIETRWHFPIVLTAGFPDASGALVPVTATVPAGEQEFAISRCASA